MDQKKIIAAAMKEIENAETYEELAAKSRCKAKGLLAQLSAPVPSSRKKQPLSQAVVLNIASRRFKRLQGKTASK